jgi:hypothetical protein
MLICEALASGSKAITTTAIDIFAPQICALIDAASKFEGSRNQPRHLIEDNQVAPPQLPDASIQ